MKGIKIMKNLVKTMIASGILAVLASCSVGLGNAVDMQPPTVNVISPERSGYILQDFLIKGTARDNIGVSELTVTIEPLDNPTESNSFFYRIKNHKCKNELSPFHSNLLSELERVADHLTNVGYSIVNPTGDEGPTCTV